MGGYCSNLTELTVATRAMRTCKRCTTSVTTFASPTLTKRALKRCMLYVLRCSIIRACYNGSGVIDGPCAVGTARKSLPQCSALCIQNAGPAKWGAREGWLCFGCMRKGGKPPVHWDGKLVEREDNGKNGYATLLALYSGLLIVRLCSIQRVLM